MAVYAIGDIQGCYDPFRRLLDKIKFQPGHDQLWIAGDMVNRGPDSLSTLRFIKSLGNDCISILGNHDLHLLAVAAGIRPVKKKDTLGTILNAPDREELIEWLRHRPLLHHDKNRNITMVHAGIPPIWTIKQARFYAEKLERALQANDYRELLHYLFSNDKLDAWENALTRRARLKMITAYFTRMRFCDENGKLDLENKTAYPRKGFYAWFQFPGSPTYKKNIVFGHWAALEGNSGRKCIHAIDTGCVWGGEMTALNLKTFKRTSVPAD